MFPIRHGGLKFQHFIFSFSLLTGHIWTPAALAGPLIEDTLIVGSKVMDVDYEVSSDSLPLKRVQLWITNDSGRQWKLAGEDSDLLSPFRLQVEQDGLYGVYWVISNDAGDSEAPPQAGQTPQHWIVVDSSPPLAQIKQAKVIEGFAGQPSRLVMSWAAFDAQLKDRPISIYYQFPDKPEWRPVVTHIRNAGRYDWELPVASGELEIKLEAVDEADNIASDTTRLSLSSLARPSIPTSNPSDTSSAQREPAVDKTVEKAGAEENPVDPKMAAKAQELYDLGIWHKERGDYDLAAERFIESMNFDPSMLAPAHELGEIFYAQKKYQSSLDVFQNILSRHAEDADALRGSALTMVALKRYPEASDQLERVLKLSPKDAQSWLDAGDIFVWMGQQEKARQYWTQACKLSNKQSDLYANGQKRLKKFSGQGK